MKAWEIWEQATERGDAVKLSLLTGKSAEWFRSWGRQPRSDEHPFGTGNTSPVETFMQVVRWLRGVNPLSAQRLRQAVDRQLKDEEGLYSPKTQISFPYDSLWELVKSEIHKLPFTEQAHVIDRVMTDLESYRNGLRLDDIEDSPMPTHQKASETNRNGQHLRQAEQGRDDRNGNGRSEIITSTHRPVVGADDRHEAKAQHSDQ